MSLYAMPLVIINMGAEMLYILEQRLTAQNIDADKGAQVLTDIAAAMFQKDYIMTLFQPQEVYRVHAVRKIFERLAHTSIMRLNENSMDKLYDLMLMGLKYQLVCSATLDTMLQVTRTHLSQVRDMLAGLPEAAPVLDSISRVEGLVDETYGSLTMGALYLIRQSLLRFLQDRRVKVSLFLQEGIQTSAARLIFQNPGSTKVGTVTHYAPTGAMSGQEKVKVKAMEFEPVEFFIHPVPLGVNLYNMKRQKVVPPVRKGDAAAAAGPAHDDVCAAGENREQYAEDYRLAQRDARAQQELKLLSALLANKPQEDNFKLQLFDDIDSLGGPSGGDGGTKSLVFGQAAGNRYKEGMIAALNLDDKPAASPTHTGTAKRQEEEDLLDLLDS